MLRDAAEQHDDGRPEAESSLQLIGDSIPLAVIGCIRAACNEISSERQLSLMQVALFGMAYMRSKNVSFNSWALCKACEMLRILNAVRLPDVGIPLTYAQFCEIGMRALVDRLINMNHHRLAAEITSKAGKRILKKTVQHALTLINNSKGVHKVLKHWAMSKIPTSTEVPDSVVLEVIRTKLSSSPGLSYAEVAQEAHSRGRTRLVRKLLEYEPKSSAQVPLLNRLGDNENALAKAIESRDADLIYLTIFHLQRHLPFQDLASMLSNYPQAKALFVAGCKRTDKEMLKSFYYSTGETARGAETLLREAFASHLSVPDSEWRKNVIQLCGQASVMYGRSRDVFHSSGVSDCVRLLEDGLASTPRVSLANSVRMLLSSGEDAAAQKLRVAHGMDERHFFHMRIHALGRQRSWSGLESLGKQRSPVGYLPFIEVAQRFDAPAPVLEALVARIPDATTRSQLFAASGLSAASAAAAAEGSGTTRRFPFFKVGGS